MPATSDSRVSKQPYHKHMRGLCGQVTSAERVIENKNSDRIHTHTAVHGTVLNPDFICRIVAGESLYQAVSKIIDSLSCTHLQPQVRDWLQTRMETAEKEGLKMVPIYDASLPCAQNDYEQFAEGAQKHLASAPEAHHAAVCADPHLFSKLSPSQCSCP